MTILSLPKQRHAVAGPEATDTGWRPGDWDVGLTFGLSTWRITYETVVIQVSGEVDSVTTALQSARTCVPGPRAIVLGPARPCR
jgi:hypothetical protein